MEAQKVEGVWYMSRWSEIDNINDYGPIVNLLRVLSKLKLLTYYRTKPPSTGYCARIKIWTKK